MLYLTSIVLDSQPTAHFDSNALIHEPFEAGSDTGLSDAMIAHPMDLLPDDSFDDLHDQALEDFLANNIFIHQPTALTPIPEVSEYSLVSSSLASGNPAGSWDSGDLSPSGVTDNRAITSRRLLRQLLQQLRPPSDTRSSPERDIPSSSDSRTRDSSSARDMDQSQKRSSYGSAPSESGGNDPASDSLHTRPSSSRSSLGDFIRMENSCEDSRVDLSEEERQLILGQNDTSLRDLVTSLQAMQQQHLEEASGTAALVSAESSSGSHLAMGSGEIERGVGAVNLEMLRAAESNPSISRVASIMAAQMQQLIRSVSTSSSSISSHPQSSSSGVFPSYSEYSANQNTQERPS